MAFKRIVPLREFSISRHQIWCAHAIVVRRMHACACKCPLVHEECLHLSCKRVQTQIRLSSDFISHSSSNTVAATQACYTFSSKSYGLYPSHDALQVQTFLAQQCCDLLRPFARSLRESGSVKISIQESKHSSKFQKSKNLQNVNLRVEALWSLALTRANVLVRGSLNGLLGEICGVVTEYCLMSCLVCVLKSTSAHEAALLQRQDKEKRMNKLEVHRSSTKVTRV